MAATRVFQFRIPLVGWTVVSSMEEMALMLNKHALGFKKLAPVFAEKIWSDTPSGDIETILANLNATAKRKDMLRDWVRVVTLPPRPPSPQRPRDPPAPRRPNRQAPVPGPQPPPPPYGPLRGHPGARAEPYQRQQEPYQRQQEPQQDPNWKTRRCFYFDQGYCNKMHTCKFVHGENDYRERYCTYFLNGEVDSCPERWTGRCTGFHEPMLMM
jgi:hypothetical protein